MAAARCGPKIDMASPNLNMRDPVLYRILHAHHHRSGDKWCIYPMYDFTHGQSDSLERITHSICTLEFENHRPLYDWFCEKLGIYHPQQIEFARLNLTYTMMSKRRLLELVREGHVRGWDDPRMPTIQGLRRRGYTPEAVREFCRRIGVTKFDGVTDIALLEHCLREDLNRQAPASDGRAPAAAGRAGQLSRGAVRGTGSNQQSRRSDGRHAEGAFLARALYRTGRLPGGSAQEVLSPGSRAGSPPALRVLHHLPGSRPRRAGGDRRGPLPHTIRRRGVAMRPTAARSKARFTGCPPSMPCPSKSGSTNTCSGKRTPTTSTRRERTGGATSTRIRSKWSSRHMSNRVWPAPLWERLSVRAARLLLPRSPIRRPTNASSTGP